MKYYVLHKKVNHMIFSFGEHFDKISAWLNPKPPDYGLDSNQIFFVIILNVNVV